MQAVTNLHLCDRAAEEVQRVRDDMQCAMSNLITLHNGLTAALRGSTSIAVRALLHRRTAEIEIVMKNIWKAAAGHLIDIPDMPEPYEPEILTSTLDCDDCDSICDSCSSDEDCV